nr:PREDICTED: CDGSH iron-sulfur domain-containing protein 2 [Apteryx mantelli mantelli]
MNILTALLHFIPGADQLLKKFISEWLRLLPFLGVLALLGYLAVRPFLPKKKQQKDSLINLKIQKENPKVVNEINIEDLCLTKAYCRCWRSKTFPVCDGSHNKHNELTGDNPTCQLKRGMQYASITAVLRRAAKCTPGWRRIRHQQLQESLRSTVLPLSLEVRHLYQQLLPSKQNLLGPLTLQQRIGLVCLVLCCRQFGFFTCKPHTGRFTIKLEHGAEGRKQTHC